MTAEFKPGDRVVLEGTIFMFRSDLDAPFLVRIESNEGLLYFAESALRHAPVREDAEPQPDFKDLAQRLYENALRGFEGGFPFKGMVECVECHASQSSLLSSPLQHNENCAISEAQRLFAEPTEGET